MLFGGPYENTQSFYPDGRSGPVRSRGGSGPRQAPETQGRRLDRDLRRHRHRQRPRRITMPNVSAKYNQEREYMFWKNSILGNKSSTMYNHQK